ncbi:MAG: hypothetical protein LUF33_04300, partial [Clostridiales bacterium]|nr:hypothetical protein [Clostridiales bacterium]
IKHVKTAVLNFRTAVRHIWYNLCKDAPSKAAGAIHHFSGSCNLPLKHGGAKQIRLASELEAGKTK